MPRASLSFTAMTAAARPAGWLWLTCAMAVLAWQLWLATEDVAQLRRHRQGLAALESVTAARTVATAAADRTRHGQIEAVARGMAMPATTLLDALEAQAPTGVVLTRLTHNASTTDLLLDVRAPTLQAGAEYTKSLARLPQVQGVRVVEGGAEAAATGKPRSFRIAATWPAVVRAGAGPAP